MPKIAYTEEEKEQIRLSLIHTGLELMSRQGIKNTTVEQIYKKVGISRTFFYSFFQAKEDLIVEALYLQQPRLIVYAQSLANDPSLTFHEAAVKFLHSCCYGEKNGIAVLSVEEQKRIFKRLPEEKYNIFRQKQQALFGRILEVFGIRADRERISLFTNLILTVLIIRKSIPNALPLFVSEAADQTAAFQIQAIADYMEQLREEDA